MMKMSAVCRAPRAVVRAKNRVASVLMSDARIAARVKSSHLVDPVIAE